MKKFMLFVGIAAMLVSCSGNQKKLDEDSQKIADLSEQYKEATNFNDSLMLLMGDIYTGLDSINQQEGLLFNMGTGDNVDRRAEIRQNLARIKERLNANKQLLEKMESDLSRSNGQNSVLQKTIAQLKQHIEQQDRKIAQLQEALDNAQGQIADLNNQVAEGRQEVEKANAATAEANAAAVAAENEANKCFYAIGTNKELKKNGLLQKKFLGATKVLEGDINTNYLTQADKRTLNSIPTNGKKIKVWSNMPAGSYEIVGEKNGPKTLKITNKDAFWGRSNILVIQVDD
ncbi:MAG: hypothetical protein NC097_04010 [Clostridium sp.]|nr:hypothetical protein [Prevotella sp.]MCM1378125.1 hypothetical protein [Prevotella sp.]MCM1428941.1 hypothetical protein [Clostridium sp.]MCM1475975.1 hypothetical protein [Muribaculaceae bacterium]